MNHSGKGTPLERSDMFFIFDSVRENSEEEIRALMVDFPELVHVRDDNGFTPLHFAVHNPALVSFFISCGADVNARSAKDYTPLHLAVSEGRRETTEILVSHGADMNAKEKAHAIAPLHLAAMKGNLEMTQLLVSKGAQVNIEAENNFTPLKTAASKGFIAVVDYLRSKGGS
jgi:ankyrin repeat protein